MTSFFLGDRVRVVIEQPDGRPVIAEMDARREIEPGATLSFRIDPSRAIVL
jgi:hypothetical protein